MAVSVLGIGREVPPAKDVGGHSRAIVPSPCGPSELALRATERACKEAGWSADAIEMIVFATMTPDVTFPGAGCFLQDKLGAATVGALDVRGQCAGFLMGLSTAVDFIAAGKYRNVLLASGEVHSSGLDHSPAGAEVAALYGDGAGVVALGEGEGVATVGEIVCGSDGRYFDRFWCEFPSSRRYPTRLTIDDFEQGKHYPLIDRGHVVDFGVAKLPEVVGEVLAASGCGADEVDLFVLSHIYGEVVDAAAASLGVSADRLVIAGAEHGHLTAASLPVALDEARASGRVGAGAKVCLAACGAGYAWGAALLDFT